MEVGMKESQEKAIAISAKINWEDRGVEEVLWQFFDEGFSDDPLEAAVQKRLDRFAGRK
jgi:hypothetical protein